MLDRDLSAVLCFTRHQPIDADGKPFNSPRNAPGVRREFNSNAAHLRYRDVLLHCDWCYEMFGLARTAVMRRTGLQRFYYGGDKMLLVELSLLGRFEEAPEVLFFPRQHPAQSSAIPSTAARQAYVDPASRRRFSCPDMLRFNGGYLALALAAPLSLTERLRCLLALTGYLIRPSKLQHLLWKIGRAFGFGAEPPLHPALARAAQVRRTARHRRLGNRLRAMALTRGSTQVADKVLITGGSGGMGAAAVRACAARGAWPVAGYCNNRAGAAETIRQCGAGEILHLDLTRDDLGSTDGLPRVDRLLHCAGVLSSQRSLLATPAEELQTLFAAHVVGPLKLTQQLLASGSPLKHVLFVLSSAAGCRGSGPYALSKAAALAACKLLAGELAPRGIQLTAFAPGGPTRRWPQPPLAVRSATSKQSSCSTSTAGSYRLTRRAVFASGVCSTLRLTPGGGCSSGTAAIRGNRCSSIFSKCFRSTRRRSPGRRTDKVRSTVDAFGFG